MTRIISPLEAEKLSSSQVAKQAREQRRAEALRSNLLKRKQWQQAQLTQPLVEEIPLNTHSTPEQTNQQHNVKG